jgi:hypothetical protein
LFTFCTHETFVTYADTTVSVLAKCSADHYSRPLIAEQFYWTQVIIIKKYITDQVRPEREERGSAMVFPESILFTGLRCVPGGAQPNNQLHSKSWPLKELVYL